MDVVDERKLRETNEVDIESNAVKTSGETPCTQVIQKDDDADDEESEQSTSLTCRICLMANTKDDDRLISPCHCRGSLELVHINCLERWLDATGRTYCELCLFRFQTTSVLRHSAMASLRIWYRHPFHRRLLFSDILLCVLFIILGFTMTLICVLALEYFVHHKPQTDQQELPQIWTTASMMVFLIIVVVSSILNIFLVMRSQIIPWFRWWRHNRRVKLLIE
ncbi:hypothetical protein DMENIID0001_051250 [Sergentomyia squamirostris]